MIQGLKALQVLLETLDLKVLLVSLGLQVLLETLDGLGLLVVIQVLQVLQGLLDLKV